MAEKTFRDLLLIFSGGGAGALMSMPGILEKKNGRGDSKWRLTLRAPMR